jgi:hypothetical protein
MQGELRASARGLDEHYGLVDEKYIALHEDCAQKTEAVIQSEKARSELDDKQNAVLAERILDRE